jgi:dTDP-4-dehydrorhamnose 3,5-epimerase
MKVHATALPDVLVVEPVVHRDARGFFLETWREQEYRAAGISGPFVQDNHSRSTRGTLRGLHAQLRRPQGKLVRVTAGAIFDVAVDIRPESPTFGRWVGERLDDDHFRQLWVPPGFAHGFCVLSETAHVVYKCTDYYDRNDEITISWRDPEVGIVWPVAEPLVSAKDLEAPSLRSVLPLLQSHAG